MELDSWRWIDIFLISMVKEKRKNFNFFLVRFIDFTQILESNAEVSHHHPERFTLESFCHRLCFSVFFLRHFRANEKIIIFHITSDSSSDVDSTHIFISFFLAPFFWEHFLSPQSYGFIRTREKCSAADTRWTRLSTNFQMFHEFLNSTSWRHLNESFMWLRCLKVDRVYFWLIAIFLSLSAYMTSSLQSERLDCVSMGE